MQVLKQYLGYVIVIWAVVVLGIMWFFHSAAVINRKYDEDNKSNIDEMEGSFDEE